ncbi:uncharacterized protein LOC121274851 [Carcharodon carcharias]|uniref:uncharacterized protein LOC121274851 n=1 Tax=Carcharodon carcharias TaxID=13397 RepID=UPI001B7F78FE|nr:uncharacterized protein LOC121274851 [Carcharodon carcharias]
MFSFSVLIGIALFGALTGKDDVYDLPKPDLFMDPPYEVFVNGENITLKCRCHCPFTRIQYYHGSVNLDYNDYPLEPCKAHLDYLHHAVAEGYYRCQCMALENNTWRKSTESDPVHIHLAGQLSQPSIIKSKATLSRASILISCKGDIRSTGGRFYLYNNRYDQPQQVLEVLAHERTVSFTVKVVENSSVGNYSCRYGTKVLGRWMESPLSPTIAVTEGAGDNELLLHVGLGCGASIIVVLTVVLTSIFIVKTGRNKRQKFERGGAAACEVHLEEDNDNMYVNPNSCSYYDAMGVSPGVAKNEEEGLLYATLNLEVLNENAAASVFSGETVVYSDVKNE